MSLSNVENFGDKDKRVLESYLGWIVNREPAHVKGNGRLQINHVTLPNDKILDHSELKRFADNKINEPEKLKYVLEG